PRWSVRTDTRGSRQSRIGPGPREGERRDVCRPDPADHGIAERTARILAAHPQDHQWLIQSDRPARPGRPRATGREERLAAAFVASFLPSYPDGKAGAWMDGYSRRQPQSRL